MKEQVQDHGFRLSVLEFKITQISMTQNELQKEFDGLKSSLEKALNSLIPKIDSLLSDRKRTVNTIPTGSASVAVAPVSPRDVFVELEEPKKTYFATNSPAPRVSAKSVFQAAEIGDVACLLSHFYSGTSANKRNEKGFTPLHLAVSGGQEETVKALLNAGASVNARGPSYTTSLHIAAEKGLINIVKVLSEAGADINAQNTDKDTPFLIAVKRGHSSLVKLLLERGASLNVSDHEGNTALLLEIINGDTDMAKFLIEKGALLDKCDPEGNTALLLAIQKRHTSVGKFLIEKGASLGKCDTEGNTALLLKMKKGNYDMAKLLIEKGASLDVCDNGNKTALWYAVYRGANDLIKLLCDKGASVSLGKSPLVLASARGNAETVMLLLQCKKPANNIDIMNALSVAKDDGVVWTFDDARPGILKTSEAEGALRMAARDGRFHIVMSLLDTGVNVNARDFWDETALYYAKINNQTKCVELLLERGAKE